MPHKAIGLFVCWLGLAGGALGQEPVPPPRTLPGQGLEALVAMPGSIAAIELESEAQARVQLRKQAWEEKRVATFPEDMPLTAGELTLLPPTSLVHNSGYVCFRPLYYRDSLPSGPTGLRCLDPVRQLTCFYAETFILPCKLLHTPPWTWQCQHP